MPTEKKARKRATKKEMRQRGEVVGELVNDGVSLANAVKIQSKGEGEDLTNRQIQSRANEMRQSSFYREKINAKKDKMEMRTVEAIERIDKDIVKYIENCDMSEKLDILRVLQSRMGFLNREAGITLNVAILGDTSGVKRKMNFNPAAGEWAWDNYLEEYVHLPTAQVIEKKLKLGFVRHPSCNEECQKVRAERDTFADDEDL